MQPETLSTTATLSTVFGPIVSGVLQFLLFFLFLLIPLALIRVFWGSWVAYVRAAFFAQQRYTLLELKIPRGLAKSPLAMEIFITSLYQTGGEGNWYDKFWLGKTRPWFSLELVSIDGNVRFFLWTREGFKDLLETQLYAQFPDIGITDVVDYAKAIPFDPTTYQYWGCEFKKTGASHLPIKTYEQYNLHDDPKEEYKIDPITSVLEFLGSLRRGEQVWIQIVIRAHKKEWTKPGTWFEKVDWRHEAEEDIKKRTKRDLKVDKDKPVNQNIMQLTKGERDAVEAIERSLSKIPFDCGIRAMYIARADSFRSITISGLTGSFRQFNAANLNGFAPSKTPTFDYPWQDMTGKRSLRKKKELFDLYRYRSFFLKEYIPVGYEDKPFVMTTEELATIFHFPGDVSKTPTLGRVDAKKAEPPANLPI